jgi:ribosome-associated protein
LLQLSDQRITKDKVIGIKAQRFRTQEKNKGDSSLEKEGVILEGVILKTRFVSVILF